jgi:hypothetical protein
VGPTAEGTAQEHAACAPACCLPPDSHDSACFLPCLKAARRCHAARPAAILFAVAHLAASACSLSKLFRRFSCVGSVPYRTAKAARLSRPSSRCASTQLAARTAANAGAAGGGAATSATPQRRRKDSSRTRSARQRSRLLTSCKGGAAQPKTILGEITRHTLSWKVA